MISTQSHLLPERTSSSLMKSVPLNVVCVRCKSKNLYRFGKDAAGFQKFQCKDCKRQFAPDNPNTWTTGKRKHPDCPQCGKASFLHHDYTYYSNYRCADKSCNHSFFHPKDVEIKAPSSALPAEAFSMKRMRHPMYLILAALNYYFLSDASTRQVKHLMSTIHQVSISHVTISKWVKRFAPVFQTIADHLTNKMNFANSDEWHFDETYVSIGGVDYYLWVAIDSETRFVLDYHLSVYRDSESAYRLLNSCKEKFGQPSSAVVSDRYAAYREPAKQFFPDVDHIQVESFKDLISNNLIEAFFGQYKDWYKAKRGFASYTSANQLIATYIFCHNFLKPHSSLEQHTPAEVAGFTAKKRSKDNWLLVA